MPSLKDYTPYSTAILSGLQGRDHTTDPLLVLLDLGSDTTWINRRAIPQGCNPKTTQPCNGTTIAGSVSCNQSISIDSMVLPEFFRNRSMGDVEAKVFNALGVRYDMIIGRDIINRIGMKFDSDTLTMTWDGQIVKMRWFYTLH